MPRKRAYRSGPRFGLRIVVFSVLALALVGAAANALRPKELAWIELGPGAAPPASSGAALAPSGAPHAMGGATMAPAIASADLTMRVDMGGFTPAALGVTAQRATRLLIVNPDNSGHSDGGGVHGFTVPGLGIDVRVPPLTNMIVTIPAAEPGEYAFYCDTCCGGKENPSMRGVLTVRA